MWSPYRNLLFLSFLRCHRKHPDAHGKVVYRASKEMAEDIARFAHGDKIVNEDASRGVKWPLIEEGKPELCKEIGMSSRLKTFLIRGRRRGRKILDRLILAFTSSGFGPEEVSKYAYEEYDTAQDVPELTEGEVALYHAYFWSFGSLIDLSKGIEWIEHHFAGEDEARIIRGDLSVSAVRAKLGTTAHFDYASRMRSLAQRSLEAMERCIAETNAIDREKLLYGKSGQQGFSNANVRNTAAMISSLAPVVKNYRDVLENEGGEGGAPMSEHLEERLDQVIDEAEEYEKRYGDWQETHKGQTPEDLMEENEEVMDEVNAAKEEKGDQDLSGSEGSRQDSSPENKKDDFDIDELL